MINSPTNTDKLILNISILSCSSSIFSIFSFLSDFVFVSFLGLFFEVVFCFSSLISFDLFSFFLVSFFIFLSSCFFVSFFSASLSFFSLSCFLFSFFSASSFFFCFFFYSVYFKH